MSGSSGENAGITSQEARELEIIGALDLIRDTATDPRQLLTSVAQAVAGRLGADLCLLSVVDDVTGQPELRAVDDRLGVFSALPRPALDQAIHQALALETTSILEVSPDLWRAGLHHLLAAPLRAGAEGMPLGALLLLNSNQPFDEAARGLLAAAASQADSAIVQARQIAQLQTRNQQLEIIYQIDRIRDTTNEVQSLLSSIASLTTNTLQADLGLICLLDEEDGRLELKAVDDRLGVFGRVEGDAWHVAAEQAVGLDDAAFLEPGPALHAQGVRHLLAAPLTVADERLGALLLARAGVPFGPADRHLLQAVVSQTDSAIVHARTFHRLQWRNRELETLYRVDHIRDQDLEFNAMLNAVLNELCSVIDAEMGFIMLFDEAGRELELKASTADDIFRVAKHYHLIKTAADEALHQARMVDKVDLSPVIRSLVCVPLILRDQIIGVFGAVNRHGAGGFNTDDKRLLMAVTSQVDTAIFEGLEKRRIRTTFRRFVGPVVMERMLNMPARDFFKVERLPLTVLFSDMRGFTTIAERTTPEAIVETLNQHFTAMTEVVLAHEGTLDKFVGDEVMAVFGAPVPMPDHALRAMQTALEMQRVHGDLLARWMAEGREGAPIGIGINTGEMVVGNIGCELQVDYTVIGDAVNLGARLCGIAQAGQILISEATYQLARDHVQVNKLSPVRVKGRTEPVQIYEVLGLQRGENNVA
jgi:adenylate cyclase